MIKEHFKSIFDRLNSGFSGFRFTGGKTTFVSALSFCFSPQSHSQTVFTFKSTSFVASFELLP